jgi:DNA repair protein RecO (recombination protein O)
MGTAEPRGAATARAGGHEDRRRESNRPAFVLHSYPWKETSLVIELFTRTHGRIPAVAKGARRPHSSLRGLLMAFQPVLVTWSGKGELRILHSAEWRGGVPQLTGVALLCGFYLNELLVKVLARDDPHERLFDAYADAIRDLAGATAPAAILRRFEKQLLTELGYALELAIDADTRAPLAAERRYRYAPELGPVEAPAGSMVSDDAETVRGHTLLDMARDDYSDPVTAAESKRLMRALIHHHFGRLELHTRQLVKDLQQL